MATTSTTLSNETYELKPSTTRHSRLSATGHVPDPYIHHDAAATALTSPGPDDAITTTTTSHPSQLRITLTILQPSLINFFCSFTNGLITVGLPIIARSLSLPRSLYLWPSSVYGLTSGSCLLLAGSVADLIGAKRVELLGCLLLGLFTLASGLSQTGIQLVMFRAMQGVAMAMHLPASVAIVAGAVPRGRARNIGFACLGLSQPFGFSVGLVASGIMIERIGWRSGFWLAGGALLVVTAAAVKGLPAVKPEQQQGREGRSVWWRLYSEVDWVGGMVASGGLAILAYILA
jgi:MFS family permease